MKDEPTQEYWETVIWPILQPPDAETNPSETKVVTGIVYVKDDDPRKLAQAIADALLATGEAESTASAGKDEDEEDPVELIRHFLEG